MTSHFRWLIVWMVVGAAWLIAAAAPTSVTEVSHVQLHPDSRIVIHGESNVNRFGCAYATGRLGGKKALRVAYQRHGSRINLQDAVLGLSVVHFDCGRTAITRDLRDMLEVETYPELFVAVDHLQLGTGRLAAHTSREVTAGLTITITSVSRPYTLTGRVENRGDHYAFVGTLPVRLTDFDLEPPTKLFKLVKVADEIEIELALDFSLQD
jgi:hypothetical protein